MQRSRSRRRYSRRHVLRRQTLVRGDVAGVLVVGRHVGHACAFGFCIYSGRLGRSRTLHLSRAGCGCGCEGRVDVGHVRRRSVHWRRIPSIRLVRLCHRCGRWRRVHPRRCPWIPSRHIPVTRCPRPYHPQGLRPGKKRQRLLQNTALIETDRVAHSRRVGFAIPVPACFMRVVWVVVLVTRIVTFRTAEPGARVDEQLAFTQERLAGRGHCGWAILVRPARGGRRRGNVRRRGP